MAGRTAWKRLVLAAAFVQCLLSSGVVCNSHVFFEDLRREFGASAAATGWVGSVAFAFFSLAAPLAAVMGRKTGHFAVILTGVLLTCLGVLATSFVGSLALGYVTFGVTAGTGLCFTFCVPIGQLLRWYPDRRENCRASGTAIVGGSVGIMAYGPLLYLLKSHVGWRNSLRILSVFSLVPGVLAALPFLKSPFGQDAEHVERGRSPREKEVTELVTTVSGRPAEEAIDQTAASADGESGARLLSMLQNLEVWLFVLGTALGQLGWSFVIVNYSSFMENVGISAEQLALCLLIFGGAELAFKIAFAVFGDRLPWLKVNVIAASLLLAAAISGFLSFSSKFEHMAVLATAWGACRAGMYGTYVAAGNEVFAVYGSWGVTSVANVGFGIGSLVGPFLTGSLFDSTGDYALGLVLTAVSFVSAAVCMLLIPGKRRALALWRRRGKCGRETGGETNRAKGNSPAVCTERPPSPITQLHSDLKTVQCCLYDSMGDYVLGLVSTSVKFAWRHG